MAFQSALSISTDGRKAHNITQKIAAAVNDSGIDAGLCNVFCMHTSCALFINENADPRVLHDLETLISRIAPDGDPEYLHNDEGDDDMSAHFRTLLTQTSISLPIQHGRLALGTWQGLYLWEHRAMRHQRQLLITIID